MSGDSEFTGIIGPKFDRSVTIKVIVIDQHRVVYAEVTDSLRW